MSNHPTVHYAHDIRGLVYRVEDADQVISELRNKVAELEAENSLFWDIANHSTGVVGWHLNGNVATWDELQIHTAQPEDQQ